MKRNRPTSRYLMMRLYFGGQRVDMEVDADQVWRDIARVDQ